ncbi:hypothetical protein ACJMK2_006323 [Sinanodonta woodiana]|uniref:G-protein coupled receptors family 1 profile domain-containing protein n=1 Tax=Sinanodonta woodiana TaxID=1069815 RepID=A0ABD3VSS5_SINWO
MEVNDSDKQFAEELNENFTSSILPVTIFFGAEACVGVLGNSLIMYVFSFKYNVCNFKYFVLVLAFIDLTSCLTTIPGEAYTQRFWYTYPDPNLCKAKSFFNVFTVFASALCLFLIAVDRHRKICKPFGWQIGNKMALRLCFIALILSAIVALPVPFLWGTQNYEKSYKGMIVNVTSCEKDAMFENAPHPLIYSSCLIVLLSIPMVFTFILYTLIAKKMLCEMKYARYTSLTVKKENILKTASFSIENGTRDESHEFNYESIRSSLGSGNILYEKNFNENEDNRFEEEDCETCEINNYLDCGSEPNNSKLDRAKMVVTLPKRGAISRSMKRKTMIMFILSAVFIFSTVLYLTLLSQIAREDSVIRSMTSNQRVLYFFFFRLYFINHVINPFVYAFLDTQFRLALVKLVR